MFQEQLHLKEAKLYYKMRCFTSCEEKADLIQNSRHLEVQAQLLKIKSKTKKLEHLYNQKLTMRETTEIERKID